MPLRPGPAGREVVARGRGRYLRDGSCRVVVLRDGFSPSDDLALALQEHARRETAPYKYPRVVDFASELPKTASGKVKRALLRSAAPDARP